MAAKTLFKEATVHLFFEASLLVKGAFALFEIAGGIIAYFISQRFLLDLMTEITQDELREDPRDFVANYLLHQAQHFSLSAQNFAAFFLLSHGIVKLWLIAGLLREKLWYYPTAIVVFALFIVYQLYRFSFTHSFLLLVITALDAVIIGLTWHEYRYLRRSVAPN